MTLHIAVIIHRLDNAFGIHIVSVTGIVVIDYNIVSSLPLV